jgi:hypothetical protein
VGLFRSIFKRASDAASEVAEPVQTVSSAVLIGGIAAGLVVGGSILYSKMKSKRD